MNSCGHNLSDASLCCSLPDFCYFYPRSPDAADSSSFDVQLGDIILTATDGLFDNMPDYMILQELKKLKVSGTNPCSEPKPPKCLFRNKMTST